jgi:hypothetical protein
VRGRLAVSAQARVPWVLSARTCVLLRPIQPRPAKEMVSVSLGNQLLWLSDSRDSQNTVEPAAVPSPAIYRAARRAAALTEPGSCRVPQGIGGQDGFRTGPLCSVHPVPRGTNGPSPCR